MCAEHLNQNIDRPSVMEDGFASLGKPVPFYRQQEAHDTCKEFGLESDQAYDVVAGMSEAIRRDRPYEAIHKGMGYVDLTGTYRLLIAYWLFYYYMRK